MITILLEKNSNKWLNDCLIIVLKKFKQVIGSLAKYYTKKRKKNSDNWMVTIVLYFSKNKFKQVTEWLP